MNRRNDRECASETFSKGQLADWLRATAVIPPDTGMDAEVALEQARMLLMRIEQGDVNRDMFEATPDRVEVLHALCALISRVAPLTERIPKAAKTFAYIAELEWPGEVLGGKAELLARCAFVAWQAAFRTSDAAAENKWRRTFAEVQVNVSAGLAARRLLDLPIEEWPSKEDSAAWDIELLLAVVERMQETTESRPEQLSLQASALYEVLDQVDQRSQPESSYLRGAVAMVCGGVSRLLGRRNESRRWFDRAQEDFSGAPNRESNLARLEYQRLTLRLEEWAFEETLRQSRGLIERFLSLRLPEDAMKARFLAAVALKEEGRNEEARETLNRIFTEALALRQERYASVALENIFQIHAFEGDAPAAVRIARDLIPMLRRTENRVGLAKTYLSVGYLFRAQENYPAALEAFAASLRESSDVGLTADVVWAQLLIADVLFDAGRAAEAIHHIRAALDHIDTLELVPEGIAAVSLLRQSVQRRQIDRQALKSLKDYLEHRRDRSS